MACCFTCLILYYNYLRPPPLPQIIAGGIGLPFFVHLYCISVCIKYRIYMNPDYLFTKPSYDEEHLKIWLQIAFYFQKVRVT